MHLLRELIYARRQTARKRTARTRFVKLIGEKRARENPAGLIVNCKQFRNCVDKAIKPFDRPCTGRGEARCSVTNTSADVITAQTESDNAIWIIHDGRRAAPGVTG